MRKRAEAFFDRRLSLGEAPRLFGEPAALRRDFETEVRSKETERGEPEPPRRWHGAWLLLTSGLGGAGKGAGSKSGSKSPGPAFPPPPPAPVPRLSSRTSLAASLREGVGPRLARGVGHWFCGGPVRHALWWGRRCWLGPRRRWASASRSSRPSSRSGPAARWGTQTGAAARPSTRASPLPVIIISICFGGGGQEE